MMKDELRALAQRVMALAGPDREVDAKIGFAVGYRMSHGQWWSPQQYAEARRKKRAIWGEGLPARLPTFTASIDAAMTLVPDGWDWEVSTRHPGLWAWVGNDNFDPSAQMAATPALALTAAALLALAEQCTK